MGPGQRHVRDRPESSSMVAENTGPSPERERYHGVCMFLGLSWAAALGDIERAPVVDL